MADPPAAPPRTDRFLLGIIAGSALLIALAVGAVFLAGRQAPRPPADPQSPVGVVQAYVEAIRSGDLARAHGHLSRAAQSSLPLSTYRERFPRYVEPASSDQRVLIEPVVVEADRAEVKVTISRFSARSDPFSARTFHRDVTVRLVREDGAWRVDQPAEPYPFLY